MRVKIHHPQRMKDALVALLVATTAICAAGDVSVSMASATLGPTGARGRDAAVPAAAPVAEKVPHFNINYVRNTC